MKKSLLFALIFTGLLTVVLFSGDIYQHNDSSGPVGEWKKIDRSLVTMVEMTRQGKKNVLQKTGETWKLLEPVAADVDPIAVSDLLKGIEGITFDSLISSKNEKRAVFQVDETGIAVIARNTEGKVLASFVIGKAAPDFSHTYIRMADSDNIYWGKGFKRYQFDKEAKMWRNRAVLSFNKDDAIKVTLASHDSAIVFEKEGDVWMIQSPVKYKAESSKLQEILNLLSAFNATDFEDTRGLAETSLDSPLFEVIVESKEKELGRLLVGKEEGDLVYLKNSQHEQIFTVHKGRLDGMKKDVDEYKAVETGSSK